MSEVDKEPKILELTIDYKGFSIKIVGGRVYAQAFGTTIYDHSMHYSWVEIKQKDMSEKFKRFLINNNLL